MSSIWAKIVIKALFCGLAWIVIVIFGVIVPCPLDEKKQFIPISLLGGLLIFVLVVIYGITRYFV